MIDEVKRYFNLAVSDVRAAENAVTADDIRNAWERFLSNYSRTIGRLIDIGKADRKTVRWSQSLKELSNGKDEGMNFLREARNHVEHGITPFAKFGSSRTSIGPDIVVGEARSITIHNCIMTGYDGQPAYIDHFHSKKGRIQQAAMTANIRPKIEPGDVQLLPIYSPRKKKTIAVPKAIAGNPLTAQKPIELMKAAVEDLRARVAEFERRYLV